MIRYQSFFYFLFGEEDGGGVKRGGMWNIKLFVAEIKMFSEKLILDVLHYPHFSPVNLLTFIYQEQAILKPEVSPVCKV